MTQKIEGTGPQEFPKDTTIGGNKLGCFGDGVFYDDAAKRLPVQDIGKFISLFAAGVQDVSLPLLSDVPYGATITIHNPSDARKVITVNGSDKISPDGNLLDNVSIGKGEVATFVSESDVWRAYGTGLLRYMDSYTVSFAGNGYQQLPSGLIIQWGVLVVAQADTPEEFTFPIAFPTANLLLIGCSQNGLPTSNTHIIQYNKNNRFTGIVSSSSDSSGTAYIAIGY